MTEDQNKAALERYIECTNAREPIDWYFAATYTYHGPMGDADRAGFLEQHEAFLSAFPDAKLTILDLVVEGDKTVTRWSAEGTHHGTLMGIAATGRRVKITGIIITRFVDGKAAEEWEEINLLGLMQQLEQAPG